MLLLLKGIKLKRESSFHTNRWHQGEMSKLRVKKWMSKTANAASASILSFFDLFEQVKHFATRKKSLV